MKCLLVAIAWLLSLSCPRALVHYKEGEKGSNGCKIDGEEVAVGAYKQDVNTCGAYTCQNKDGGAFIHYCQIPVTFAECPETAVLTKMDFPQCCWACASWVKCAGSKEGGGEGGGAADGKAAEGAKEGAAAAAEKPAERAPPAQISPKGDKASLVLAKSPKEALPASNNVNHILTSGTKKPGGPREPELAENLKFGGRTPITHFGEEPKITQPGEEVDLSGTKLYEAPKEPPQ